MNFIEKIEMIMNEKGITAYKMCKDLGITQTTMSSWKKGSKPNIDAATKIMRYLAVSADEILELDQDPNELELLTAFRKLPERQKIKWITRIEDAAAEYKKSEEESDQAKHA